MALLAFICEQNISASFAQLGTYYMNKQNMFAHAFPHIKIVIVCVQIYTNRMYCFSKRRPSVVGVS